MTDDKETQINEIVRFAKFMDRVLDEPIGTVVEGGEMFEIIAKGIQEFEDNSLEGVQLPYKESTLPVEEDGPLKVDGLAQAQATTFMGLAKNVHLDRFTNRKWKRMSFLSSAPKTEHEVLH